MKISEVLERECKFLETKARTNSVLWGRVVMAYYRMLTFDSQLYFLLHGSTVITKNGNGIMFGDGVECIGKTCCSLEVCKNGGKLVVDENSLYNEATGFVSGNLYQPIHIRDNKGERFELASELGLDCTDGVKLSAIVCPHKSDTDSIELEKNFAIKSRKLAVTCNAHRMKFFDSSLDNLSEKGDEVIIKDLLDNAIGYHVPDKLLELPYYDAYLTNPKNIIKLLDWVKL